MTQAVNAVGRAGLLGFTRYQWLVFFVVWLGWALDATDFNLFSLVLKPAVTEVLGGTPTPADIGKWGGLLAMIGLLGWALGGMFFGVVADAIGQVRTLVISIILVAVFTAAQGLSQNIVQFGVCRFLSGVGTGAEIVVGIPLLAEAFADKAARAKVLGFMMTGGAPAHTGIGGRRSPLRSGRTARGRARRPVLAARRADLGRPASHWARVRRRSASDGPAGRARRRWLCRWLATDAWRHCPSPGCNAASHYRHQPAVPRR